MCVLYEDSTFFTVSSSFGGGFEMMKAGGDQDGLWTLLLDGLQ